MTSTRKTTYEENEDNEENNTNEDSTTQENADREDTTQFDQDKLDKLLLNLRTISEIKDFDKLRVNNEILQIDQSSFQFITRWYYAEGRDNTLNKTSDILQESFSHMESIKNTT